MTKQNAEKFIKAASEDPKLRKTAFECFQKSQKKELEKLASEKGCECTFEEIKAAFNQRKLGQNEFSNEELKALAAGGKRPSNFPKKPDSGLNA